MAILWRRLDPAYSQKTVGYHSLFLAYYLLDDWSSEEWGEALMLLQPGLILQRRLERVLIWRRFQHNHGVLEKLSVQRRPKRERGVLKKTGPFLVWKTWRIQHWITTVNIKDVESKFNGIQEVDSGRTDGLVLFWTRGVKWRIGYYTVNIWHLV